MKKVRAKKSFGQHFLNNQDIAKNIVDSLQAINVEHVIELGPGMGILSQFILEKDYNSSFVEIDAESIDYLIEKYPQIKNRIVHGDFLKVDINKNFKGQLALIGNFPYNISSQILFKMLEHKDRVVELVGMFQKEVAERVIAPSGSKVYGIISVFVQAYYNSEVVMVLGPESFSPPPKVNSMVIRLTRNKVANLECDEILFTKIVKQTFNQRRKMIRNTIKSFGVAEDFFSEYLTERPEQLGVTDFVILTNQIQKSIANK